MPIPKFSTLKQQAGSQVAAIRQKLIEQYPYNGYAAEGFDRSLHKALREPDMFIPQRAFFASGMMFILHQHHLDSKWKGCLSEENGKDLYYTYLRTMVKDSDEKTEMLALNEDGSEFDPKVGHYLFLKGCEYECGVLKLDVQSVLNNIATDTTPVKIDTPSIPQTHSEVTNTEECSTENVDFGSINYSVMMDTKKMYTTNTTLQNAVQYTVKHQYIVRETDAVSTQPAIASTTKFMLSSVRCLEAARGYVGKKVAILNFANNHSVGGSPFSSGAQEESICRSSTLFPCLEALNSDFYQKHQTMYWQGLSNELGNDDIIYSPDIVVFKDEGHSKIILPKLMDRKDWYKVDMITCAAPEYKRYCYNYPPLDNATYKHIIEKRIKRILDVAAAECVDVLILGAWGCGAFGNDAKVVAKAFHSLLKNYDFEVAEFAFCAANADFVNEFQSEPGLIVK